MEFYIFWGAIFICPFFQATYRCITGLLEIKRDTFSVYCRSRDIYRWSAHDSVPVYLLLIVYLFSASTFLETSGGSYALPIILWPTWAHSFMYSSSLVNEKLINRYLNIKYYNNYSDKYETIVISAHNGDFEEIAEKISFYYNCNFYFEDKNSNTLFKKEYGKYFRPEQQNWVEA